MGSDDPLFDETKSKLENELILSLQRTMLLMEQQENWNSLFAAAELLMVLDPIHEIALKKGLTALQKLNSTTQASRFYTRFTEHYQQLLGETYPISFNELIKG